MFKKRACSKDGFTYNFSKRDTHQWLVIHPVRLELLVSRWVRSCPEEEQLTHLESLNCQDLENLYQWEVALIQVQYFRSQAVQYSFQYLSLFLESPA